MRPFFYLVMVDLHKMCLRKSCRSHQLFNEITYQHTTIIEPQIKDKRKNTKSYKKEGHGREHRIGREVPSHEVS